MTVNRSYPGLKFTRQCDVWVHIVLNGEGRWARMINKRTEAKRAALPAAASISGNGWAPPTLLADAACTVEAKHANNRLRMSHSSSGS